MFKKLYNNIISLNINFKSNQVLNIFTFLKKSSFFKNYSNYLNFFIYINNNLKLKAVQTSFWHFNLDNCLFLTNSLSVLWILFEVLLQ